MNSRLGESCHTGQSPEPLLEDGVAEVDGFAVEFSEGAAEGWEPDAVGFGFFLELSGGEWAGGDQVIFWSM